MMTPSATTVLPGPSGIQRTARLVVTPMDIPCGPEGLLDALAACEDPVVLDSAATDTPLGRWSVLSCRPLEVLTFNVPASPDGPFSACRRPAGAEIWDHLAAAFASVRLSEPPPPDLGYLPGWFGYIGYELARTVERLPSRARRDSLMPDLRLAFYDAVLLHDAARGQWTLVELQFDDPPAHAGRAAVELRRITAHAARKPVDLKESQGADTARPLPTADAQCNFTPEDYHRAVRRAVEYVAAGDIFQVNLSQRFTVDDPPPAMAVYRALRRRNPSAYAAYLAFESAGRPCAVLSSSPELFLSLRDGMVTTRPIKGTRRRNGDPAADLAARRELWNSPKDNAELAMIVDLLRNDLGRVCRFGSVHVRRARELETHPTVFHLVAEIEGRLRDGVGAAELLRSTFPGGSITGAPKIRAMEIIDELEGLARGVYTGCIGTVGVDGSAVWNIAIRTIVHEGRRLHLHAGGGIVADSSDQGEYQETLDKARALLEAVAAARSQPGEEGP